MIGYLYIVESGGLFKIGQSVNVRKRVSSLRTGNPNATRLVASIPYDDAAKAEREWHTRFADRRVRGEWFRLTWQEVETAIVEQARSEVKFLRADVERRNHVEAELRQRLALTARSEPQTDAEEAKPAEAGTGAGRLAFAPVEERVRHDGFTG